MWSVWMRHPLLIESAAWCLFRMIIPTPAGGMPMGLLITSSENEDVKKFENQTLSK